MKKFTKKQRAAIYLKCAKMEFAGNHNGSANYILKPLGTYYTTEEFFYFYPELQIIIQFENSYEPKNETSLAVTNAYLFAHNIAKD